MSWHNLDSPTPRNRELPFEEFVYPIVSTTYLKIPTNVANIDFFSVLGSRKSRRQFGPLQTSKLESLLWFSSRTIEKSPPNQARWEHRASPSAGGRHPIDVFVINRPSARNTLSLYDPVSHALAELAIPGTGLDAIVARIDNVLPIGKANVILFGAQYRRTLSKYQNAESLVWRDAGVLLATFSLVAEALSLNCCAFGITGEPDLSRLLKTNLVFGAGGMLVGS